MINQQDKRIKRILFRAATIAFGAAFSVVIVFSNMSSAQSFLNLDFQNVAIGMGVNTTNCSIAYPEIPRIDTPSVKRSFLIDVRAHFLIPYNLRFVPLFELWSWTDNSGSKRDAIQNGVNDYLFSFDLSRIIINKNRMGWYCGGGIGIHFLSQWTKFPPFNPYYNQFNRIQIQSISERKMVVSPEALAGIEYHIKEDFYCAGELRRELNKTFKQWKFIVSICLF